MLQTHYVLYGGPFMVTLKVFMNYFKPVKEESHFSVELQKHKG